MKDFTLNRYANYLEALKCSSRVFLRFDEYFSTNNKPHMFCILRHDVDRKPQNALKMAELEAKMGIRASYFFRTKKHTLKKEIIHSIERMGHEIGYHYESLSDYNGDIKMALKDFEKNLNILRKIASVKTCAMHGSPLKNIDNRDLWREDSRLFYLKNKLAILGEVYLSIDYSDIAYINDTGRNWSSLKNNLRDKVSSQINVDFKNGKDLLCYLKNQPHPKIVFQIHPERWADNSVLYIWQYFSDTFLNSLKFLIHIFLKK